MSDIRGISLSHYFLITKFHNLIRKRLILPYLTGSVHPSFMNIMIEEYEVDLLMDLQKQDGVIRPILCGEIWLHYFASLTNVFNTTCRTLTCLSILFLTHLIGDVSLTSFCPEGFVGIGVPTGTHDFVQNFVAKTFRTIIYDVEKLDVIQDGFIHYKLLWFCQTTRLQYTNSHIFLCNRYVLQQHHVYCKIADTLLKRGTKQHADGWDWHLMILLKIPLSILLLHGSYLVLVLFPRNVRTCGCPRMIFRTRPHGHRPRFKRGFPDAVLPWHPLQPSHRL